MKFLETNVCIIGSGPGGAAAFYQLAHKSDKRILLLEAGPDLGPDLGQDADKADEATKVLPWKVQHKKGADDPGLAFQPSVYQNVSGASKFYAGALFRFREHDFREQTYGPQTSPAWPIQYADLEPYYQQAETLLNVHGRAGDDGGEGPRSGPYPAPWADHEAPIGDLAKELLAEGWTPLPTPVGLRHFCQRCRTTIVAHAQNSFIEPALAHAPDRVQLLAEYQVERLVCDPENPQKIRSIVGTTAQGEAFTIQAETVILAAGAAHSPRLLRASEITGSGRADMIGANYMFHQHTMVPLIDGDLAATTFAKTLCYNTYFGNGKNQEADPSHAFGHVQIMGAITPELLRAYMPARFRRWVPTWLLNRLSSNMVLFLVSTEDLPLLENRIEGTDPTALRLSYTPTLTRAHRHLVRKFATDLRRAARRIRPLDRYGFLGNITLVQPLPPVNWLRRLVFFRTLEFAANAHQCGTLKMGFSEADSVTNRDGRLWGMDNLYVADASVFASSSHLNPSLTIYANALRVADGIAAETA